MFLSIIIPIYNVENYIDRCLNSIFSQDSTINDYEVICVNDGTPDKSMDIVNRYADKYGNICIINQENKGLSVARNAGLKIARGKYIWFVDSDDYVSPNSVKEIEATINGIGSDIDVIPFDFNQDSNGSVTRLSVFTKTKYKKFYNSIHEGYFFCRKLPSGICQRFLFNRDFLERKQLYFTPGIYHEDQDFMFRCYTKAKKIMPVQEAWYNYVIRDSGSITSTFKIKRFYDIMKIIDSFSELSRNNHNVYEITILQEGIFGLSNGLLRSKYRYEAEYKKFLKENKSNIKKYFLTSYFKSIRKNSLGKTYRFFIGLFL